MWFSSRHLRYLSFRDMINKAKTNQWVLGVLLSAIFILAIHVTYALEKTDGKIPFDQNPVLISDTLKTVARTQIVNPSLSQLTENIYWSSLASYVFLFHQFPAIKLGLKLPLEMVELSAINAFYQGDDEKSMQLLKSVFNRTTDSLQKAKTCLNLSKIYYHNRQFSKAMDFIQMAKDSLSRYYTLKQKYDFLFLEAEISLCQGLTSKAEHLIISQALPLSTRFKNRRNEYNCYLFLGKVYLKGKQMTQAKWFFVQANSIAMQQNDIDGKIESSLLLAKTKLRLGDRVVALQDLAKARKLIDNQHQIYLADLKLLTKLAQH